MTETQEVPESIKDAVESLVNADKVLLAKTNLQNIGDVTVIMVEEVDPEGFVNTPVVAVVVDQTLFDFLDLPEDPPTVFDVRDSSGTDRGQETT